MIITLTGNLLAERTFEFPAPWLAGKTQRATHERFQVGGKGINVSKMLTRLGAPNTALCFAGGSTGDECLHWLQSQQFNHQSFRTTSPTRTGIVIRAPGQPETTFLGTDSPPDAIALRDCAAWLDAMPASYALALCGSFPGWDAPAAAPLRDAITRRIALGNVFVDTYGPPLAWLSRQPVKLIKINRVEFDLLTSTVPAANQPALSSARPMPERLQAALAYWPAQQWVVTDGPREVWLANRDTPPTSLRPPAIQEVSATGSGDVLFACILYSMCKHHLKLEKAVSLAIPHATHNASRPDIANLDTNQLTPLMS